MPKADKHSTLARLLELLKHIPSRAPGLTTRQLRDQLEQDGYPVTLRTMERDLNELSAHFPIACEDDTASRAKRWYQLKDKPLEIGGIDLIDAVSLVLAGDVLEKVLPGVLQQPVANKISQARQKLKKVRSYNLARWSEKVRYVHGSMELLPPKIPERIMETIQSSLIEEHQIEVAYDAFQEKRKKLRLHPLSLVLRGSVPYVVATAFDYPDLRLYAVHRMRKVTELEEPISPPPDYSVDAYLSSGGLNFSSGAELILKARLSDDLAIYLTETPLAKDQDIKYRKDHYELTATVRDSWQLHFWILSQGAGITILKPIALRKTIQASLSEALQRYEPGHNATPKATTD